MRVAREVCVLVALAGCAGARPAGPRPEAPRLDGRPVSVAPLDDAAWAYWIEASRQRAELAPTVSAEAGVAELRSVLGPWLRRRAEALTALARRVPALARRSPDDALFAAVVYADVTEALGEAVRGLPTPRDLSATEAAAYRRVREEQAIPLLRHAREGWAHCAAEVPRASPSLRVWEPVCVARVEALAAQIAALESRPPPPPPASPLPIVRIPTECAEAGSAEVVLDPEAPPPDERRPREVVLRYAGERFQGAARQRLLAAVRAVVARLAGVRLLPPAEVSAAEALVAQRRWRVGGPVCGQAPPLPAVLATGHPNLVVGVVDDRCGEAPAGAGSRGECTLSVRFHRAGTADRDGLPPERAAEVTGDPADVRSWITAAAALGDPRGAPPRSADFGARRAEGSGEVLRVIGDGEVDPWLRVGTTLAATRAALLACATPAGGVGSYRVGWSVGPEGAARDVAVTVQTGPSDGSGERAAACLRGVLAGLAFPCPRAGAAVTVRAGLCVGHDAAPAATVEAAR